MRKVDTVADYDLLVGTEKWKLYLLADHDRLTFCNTQWSKYSINCHANMTPQSILM